MSFKKPKIKRSNPKAIEKIQKRIKKAKKATAARVGFPKAEPHAESEGETIPEIAFKHEFGEGRVPERSFMRTTLFENKAEITKMLSIEGKAVVNGQANIQTALGKVGLKTADLMKVTLIKLKDPPNSPYTIAKKGSSNPLIDTGQMVNSITWEVK